MREILWHGRGGQGAFTAARLLGAAASMPDDSFALAFPSFGPERRGAPMRAFTKVDGKPIGDRSAITRADYVVYLDDTLLDVTQQGWISELKDTARAACVLVNSTREYADPRIISIDANGISERVLGRPIPNTVFLGALAVLCPEIETDYVIRAVRQYMPAKLHAKNEQIIEEAICQMRLSQKRSEEAARSDMLTLEESPFANVSRETLREGAPSDASSVVALGAAASGTVALGAAALGSPASGAAASGEAHDDCRGDVIRNCTHIPVLRSHLPAPPSLDPSTYARTTCYRAGHLVAKNAGWRNERPVIDEAACTGCLQCYLYCPDGTVYKTNVVQGGGAGEFPAESHRASFSSESVSGSAASGAVDFNVVDTGSIAPSAAPHTVVSGFGASSADLGNPIPDDLAADASAPEAANYRLSSAPVSIDYDFCKGCGICACVCKFNAITMVPESEGMRS